MQAVLDVDGQLRSHEPHLRYRLTQYQETKRAIEDVEGSVADFARVRMHRCGGTKYLAAAPASQKTRPLKAENSNRPTLHLS